MIKPPRALADEQRILIETYFSKFPEDTERVWNIDEQRLENDRMRLWLYEHASPFLRLYWDWRNWYGDEGQLCDGTGKTLRANGAGQGWIQDWDVDDQGFCLFKGTQERILSPDGNPVRNPVLDARVKRLYDSEFDAAPNK